MHRTSRAVLICCLLLAGCGEKPQDLLAAVDRGLAANLPMSAEQRAEASALRAEGAALLQAGNDDAAAEVLGRAREIVKRAEDAAVYNKAD